MIGGRTPSPFDFGFLTQCVSLGRRDGIIAFVDPHDRATGRVWTGRVAAMSKEIVCRGAAWVPYRGATLYRWRGGGTQGAPEPQPSGPGLDSPHPHVTTPPTPWP